jgi:hypothetical protein
MASIISTDVALSNDAHAGVPTSPDTCRYWAVVLDSSWPTSHMRGMTKARSTEHADRMARASRPTHPAFGRRSVSASIKR